MNKKSSNKSFHSEREGQIKFFSDLRITADVELTHNTDGVLKAHCLNLNLRFQILTKSYSKP